MNYDTPPSRFGKIDVDVFARDDVIRYEYLTDQDSESDDGHEELEIGVDVIELYDDKRLSEMIHSLAQRDVETGDLGGLLRPEVAARRALDIYDVYVSDTDMPVERVVAEYMYALSEAAIAAKHLQLYDADIERILNDVTEFIQTMDTQSQHSLIA